MSCETCAGCNAELRKTVFEKCKEDYKAITAFTYSYKRHSRPTSMLLSLTNRCNLACNYCFVKQNPQDMTLEIAEKAVSILLENCKLKDQKPHLNFFGGEPLLMYEEIIVPLVEKYSPLIDFGITTNGVLLNEDIVDFFYHHDVKVLLSFDGVAEVQNKQRSNSFNQVLLNIPYLLLRLPETTMRSTVTKHSIPYLYESVLMAEELGFKKIAFCPNAYEEWDKDIENLMYEQWKKIGHHIYKGLMSNKKVISVDPLVKFYKNTNAALQENLFFNNNIERCGLGTTTCAIAPNGDIVPCQEKTSCPTVILGNVNTNIDANIHKAFLINYFNRINDISCDKGCDQKAKLNCLSDICPSRFEDLNYKFSTASCAFIRTSTSVANRLHYLCANSSYNHIRRYFGEGVISNG